MLDGNVLLRQKRDEVPEGTLSCPGRNLAVFHHYRHYEGLRLLPSVYDSKLIQQTLFNWYCNVKKIKKEISERNRRKELVVAQMVEDKLKAKIQL